MIHSAEFFVSPPHESNYRLAPLEVSRVADRVTNNLVPQVDLGADNFEVPGARRRVLYVDVANNIRQELTLQLVQHEGGAWTDLAGVGPMTAQAGSIEGRFVVNDGTMSAAATKAINVKGALFAEYFPTDGGPNRASTTVTAVDDLQNGDWYWVIIGGPYEYLGAAACAAGLPLGLGAVAQEGKLEDHTVVTAAATDVPVGWSLTGAGGVDALGTMILTLDRIAQADGLF